MSFRNLAFGALLAAILLPASAQTDKFPSRPIRLVVPWSAGGNTDGIARLMALKLSARINQQVVVDNKPGANGIVGTTAVAHAQPDGYTLMLALPETNVLNPMVYKNISYASKDLDPVAFIGIMPFALVANPSSKAATVPDLVRAAKQKPGSVSAASWGIGSTAHAAIALMEQTARVELLHVPFPGTAPAMTQVFSGQIDLMFLSALSAVEFEKSGKVKVLGVTVDKRMDAFPDVPTLAEQGLPGIDVSLWYGITAPAKTPSAVKDYLAKEILEVLKDPTVLQDLRGRGMVVQPKNAAEFSRFMAAEEERWSSLIKAKNIRIDN
jgi:tripartite-type tricarboxylate transporter receptor subunit TctC